MREKAKGERRKAKAGGNPSPFSPRGEAAHLSFRLSPFAFRLSVLLLGLLAFGLARLPFERGLAREYRAAGFHQSDLTLDVREQVGQMGFIAALSGFRSVVADVLWIRAHIAWEDTQWGRMKLLFDSATQLQPRAVLFWDNAAWHMAWNASVAALSDPRQPREVLRKKAAREYIALGEDYLLRGARYNWDRAILFDRLGFLYMQKMEDHCRASWAYFEAAKRPDAMGYVHRFALYELAKCPGHEREAYDLLVALYHSGENERLPTLLKLIDQMQIKLNIPDAERIDTARDRAAATPP